MFVCTGNIARSASAQYLAAAMLEDGSTWTFNSAGTGAMVGAGVARHIDIELAQRGAQYDQHLAKQITERLVRESALVLVMEKEHLDWIVHEWPQYRSKVHLLCQMARVQKQAGKRVDPVAFMMQYDEEPLAQDEVADPYLRGPEAAKVAVQRIQEALDIVVPWLGN
ncbi:hypothetical protein ACN08Y_07730 [Rothia sp. P5764]|uniref:arsenate reductase/protein-tyrosine-phosphatase family protein n=1 Tax=Rothia sp. P5764 TaxID=3402654 RepID=UPI003AC81B8D